MPPSPDAGPARYAGNWIDSFMEYSEGFNSPRIFRKWTAISILAAAMERKVWVVTGGRQLFANQYVLLVGPPGVGKSEAIRCTRDFASEVDDFHMASLDVSSASIYDTMASAERKIMRPMDIPPMVTFNSTYVSAGEFGIFLKQYDNAFMSKLNSMFDGEKIDETKRHLKSRLVVERPLLSILAGTTPGWLGGNLPATAWQEGFTSRLIIIYSGQRLKISLFGERASHVVLFEKMVQDLRMIHDLYGQMVWMEEVQEALMAWYNQDMPPIPDHPKLEHYLARRPVHFIKLMMACSVARSNELIVRMDDYQMAQGILLEAEETMPDVFKSMAMSADSTFLEEAYAFVFNTYHRESQKAVKKHRIINFIRERAPVHMIMKVFETMEHSRMIKVGEMDGTGNHGYVPIPKIENGRN